MRIFPTMVIMVMNPKRTLQKTRMTIGKNSTKIGLKALLGIWMS